MDGAIGSRSGSDTAGFTLVELLVAVAVLAVLAVGASLAATRGAGGAEDAQRFAERFAALRQLAVLGQSPRGLHVTARGFRMAERENGAWQEAGREIRWRGRVGFAPQDPPGIGAAPQIVFLPNGRSSAFSIRFGSGAGQLCRSDGWTGLRCGKS